MNNEKWNNVLIEWVNCLKFCKNINNVEDLRTGEFFSNIQKVITKSRNIHLDTLTFIFDLFGKHYPNYIFENKTEIHLADLPLFDLTAVTSLLMHYTCIYDRKDVLTSPLCHSLSQSTQLIIRNYLQKVTKDITNETMNSVIQTCIDDASDHLTNHWFSVDTSNKNSPLQDLLKTPVSRIGRLHEKDRIISRLQSELETERYDKAELQEELKLLLEKNKQIEQQLSQKNTEVARLRADVIALENRTPPHYQDMDSRELQRRLRSEIQSLELYIKQIEDEQEEMRKEKDVAKEQVRKLELQTGIWEEKFFETDRNFETLKEQAKKQEIDLIELQAHCAELTALLEEFRSKPENDSALYDTFTSTANGKIANETGSSEEDLACSVIEVQLREAQQHNEELRGKLQEAEEVELKLRGVVEEVEAKLKMSERTKEKLNVKVQNLESDKEALQKRLADFEKDLKESQQKSQEQLVEISTLTAQLQETSFCLQESNENNKNLLSQVTLLTIDVESMGTQLTNITKKLEKELKRSQLLENSYSDSKKIEERLQFDLADAIIENQKLNEQILKMRTENERIAMFLEDSKNLRAIIEQRLCDTQKYAQSLNLKIEGITIVNNAHIEEKQQIADNLEKIEKEKVKIQEEFDSLSKKSDEYKEEIEDLKKKLGDTVQSVEARKVENCRLEKELNQTRENKNVVEQRLEDVNISLDNLKTRLESSEKECSSLNIQRNELEQKIMQVTASLEKAELQNEKTNKALMNMKNENEMLISSLEDREEKLAEAVNKLVTTNEINECVKEKLENEKAQLRESLLAYENLKDVLENKLKEAGASNEDLQSQRQNLEQQVIHFTETKKDLLEKMSELEAEKEQVELNLEKESHISRELLQEKTKLEEMVGEFCVKNKELKEELKKSKNVEEILDGKLREATEKAQLTIENLMKVKAENITLTSKLHDNENELRETVNKLMTTEEIKNKLESEKMKLDEIVLEYKKNNEMVEEKLKSVENTNDDLVVKNTLLQKQIAIVELDLTQKNDILEKLVELPEKIESYIKENDDLKKQVSDYCAKNEDLYREIEDNRRSKNIVEEKLGHLGEELRLVNEKLTNTNDEKEVLLSKLEDVMKENEEFKVKLDYLVSLEEEFSKSKDHCKTLEKNLEEKNMILEKMHKETEILLNEKKDLEAQIIDFCTNKEELVKEIEANKRAQEILEAKIVHLDEEAHFAREDARSLKNENGNFVLKLQDVEQKLHNTSEKLLKNEEIRIKLENEIEELRGNLDLLQRLLKETEETNVSLEKKLEEKNGTVDKFSELIKELEETIVDRTTKLEEIEKQFDMDKQIFDQKLLAMTEETRIVKEEKEILSSKLQDAERKLHNTIKELAKTEEIKIKLENESRGLKQKLELLEKEIVKFENRNTNLEKNLLEKNEALDNLYELNKNLEKTIINYSSKIEELKTQFDMNIQTLEEKLTRIAEEAHVAKDGNEVLIVKLEDSVKKLCDAREELSKNEEIRIKLISESEELKEKLDELRKKVSETEARNTTLENNLIEKDKELDKISQLKKELEEKVSNYSTKNEELEKAFNLKKQALEETLCCVTEEARVAKEETHVLLSRLRDTEEKFENSEEIKTKLEHETMQLRQKLDSLEKQVLETGEENKTLDESLKNALNDKKEIVEQLVGVRNEVETLLNEKKELQAKIDVYCKKNEDLEGRLSVLTMDYKQLKMMKENIERQLNEVSVVSEALKMESEEIRVQYQKSNIELEKLIREKENLCLLLKQTQEKFDDREKREAEEKAALISKNEQFEKRQDFYEAEINKLTAVSLDYKNQLEIVQKQAEEAEENLKATAQELLVLTEKVERLGEEKSLLEKNIEVEESLTAQSRERVKSLEETLQDYEITISGLKTVVDSNLEKLETLREEQADTMKTIKQMLADNNISCNENDNLKNFISEAFTTVLTMETEGKKLTEELQNEIKELKSKTSSFNEMTERLLALVDTCPMECLKASFDNVHAKVKTLLQQKQELVDDLRKLETDKSDLNRKLQELAIEKEEILKNLTEEREKSENLRKELEIKSKPIKQEKENILSVSTRSNKSREEDLKKENMMLKRKIVLTEHAKNNLEKVLKDLREEKKKQTVIPTPPSTDVIYKKLLQEYIQVKEEHEQILKEKDAKIEELSRNVLQDDKKGLQELQNIREAYGNLMSVHSKSELEIVTLRKIIEERNSEMANLTHIKEAYEKLLEENNKVLTEIDTLKYKRNRDKEGFVRLLKKERDETSNREMKKIQEIRQEYEGKLEKMKEKMLRLYREEVNKKVKSVKDGQNETAILLKTVANLKSELFEADQKIQLLEMERDILKTNKQMDVDARTLQSQSRSSVTSFNDGKSATLPRPSITREITISQTTSIGGLGAQNLQMEDEEDLFNDKYLTDLKEGRCTLPADCRFSELAWRNSMVPPHLKSSYPAETQFLSPTRFKEEDIKAGNIEFEDSMCKLLPGEKPRKKDFGTTSYKKPGPPTPSKNGGRLSLQGNEVHPMREHCEAKTPKKSTPSRIRALFTGRNSSSTRDFESQNSVTPNRGRRLNIFKRPR